ncbi:MAG: AI-2E family transporter [Bacteroidales bacterium]|nr:AI-2E family transporter [Bacteroidales bacterium]
MITKEIRLPFYAKATIFLIGLFALLTMLYIAQGIVVPIIFAIIIAIVLHPVVNFLVRLKINRVVAIIITLALAILIFGTLGTLMFSRAIRFSESWPVLIDRFTEILNQAADWVSGYFEISPLKIDAWLIKTKEGFISTRTAEIGQTLVSVGSGVVLLFLIPVYIFMILFYQPILIEFFRRLFGKNNRNEVSEIIAQIKSLIQRYLLGLLLETSIIATLYSVGLLILGIEYAVILGIIGALLNLIPYIGAIIAASLPMMIALVSKTSPWFVLLILAMYVFIQFIDNNYIVPKLVASKVKINALITIIVVIAFGSLWGIPGMFLSIPLTAIVKLIFDHIEALKPWGFLLGDTMPQSTKFKYRLTKQDH